MVVLGLVVGVLGFVFEAPAVYGLALVLLLAGAWLRLRGRAGRRAHDRTNPNT